MNEILETLIKNEYLSVNINKVIEFINEIQDWNYVYWCEDLKRILDEKECILFAFMF